MLSAFQGSLARRLRDHRPAHLVIGEAGNMETLRT
jgi:hypothetical protein